MVNSQISSSIECHKELQSGKIVASFRLSEETAEYAVFLIVLSLIPLLKQIQCDAGKTITVCAACENFRREKSHFTLIRLFWTFARRNSPLDLIRATVLLLH
jgi:hypothetical protein